MTTSAHAPHARLPRAFGFPEEVNEKAARVVAGGVGITAVATLALAVLVSPTWLWLCLALALGFLVRTFTGLALSPLGRLASVIAPRLGTPKLVPGPPKRFAQAMGLVFTSATTVLVALGQVVGAEVLLGLIVIAAGLEAVLALCLGCMVFARLMRAGLIPASTCESCSDFARHGR